MLGKFHRPWTAFVARYAPTLPMKIHHINAGTMCPANAWLVNGGSFAERGRLICHSFVIESSDGLVVVDTGLGMDDIEDARRRLGSGFLASARPKLDPEETVLRHIERLGFERRDVRHIVPTHLDVDHAGGLPDFPEATVHVFAPEHAAAMARKTFLERKRYRPLQWAHAPKWAIHELEGDSWLGFDAIHAIPGVGPDVLLVPLVGHTRGHVGVAVRTGDLWLLHAGDAFFHFREMDPARPSCPPGLAAYQKFIAISNRKRLENQARLRELARDRKGEVEVICAHCPETFERFATASILPQRRRAGRRLAAEGA
jgi:glyoxylase-like metal-dependent hydrolase (beta-lactamase superfamily II)